ncbi:MAG: hypothetical protein LBP89_03455 [Helicobacteraceae bacterium]|jgi:hypothetical protein|nr:hypothetical protein [Helicobacteraceae bacterium]
MRIFALIFALVVSAFAHRINLFVTDENSTIYIQSYFTKSAPCMECDIAILDLEGKELFKTKTDEKGKAEIKVSDQKIVVRVDGGMGHQAEQTYELTGEIAQEQEEPLWRTILKFVFSLAMIVLFFGVIWLIKKRSRSE